MTDRKYGISSFVLHILAMSFMLLDHIYHSGLVNITWFTCVGRLAFPIFAFMIAEGFHYTRSRKKYALRLLFFAVITEIPFNLVVSGKLLYFPHQNVLWTFLMSVILLCLYEKIKVKKSTAIKVIAYPLITFVFMLTAAFAMTDYSAIGILTVALFYFTRADEKTSAVKKAVFLTVQLVVMCMLNVMITSSPEYALEISSGIYLSIQSFAVLALPIIWLYNGKQGYYNKYIKYGYYLFYPVHCLVLGALALLLKH